MAMETKQKKKKKENRFSFLYILGGGILKEDFIVRHTKMIVLVVVLIFIFRAVARIGSNRHLGACLRYGFCGKGDLDEGGREPETSEPPDLSQPWKYLFFRRQADGDQCALLLSVYRFQRGLLYPSDQEMEQLGYASEK